MAGSVRLQVWSVRVSLLQQTALAGTTAPTLHNAPDSNTHTLSPGPHRGVSWLLSLDFSLSSFPLSGLQTAFSPRTKRASVQCLLQPLLFLSVIFPSKLSGLCIFWSQEWQCGYWTLKAGVAQPFCDLFAGDVSVPELFGMPRIWWANGHHSFTKSACGVLPFSLWRPGLALCL